MCIDFLAREASANAISSGDFSNGKSQTGLVLQRILGAVLGGAILAVAGASAVMAKDLKRSKLKDSDPKTAYAQVTGVKTCDLYGEGYDYMPGTDTCIKAGGFAALELGANRLPFGGPIIGGNLPVNALPLSGDTTGTVGLGLGLGFDARTQTEYGTLRANIQVGIEWGDGKGIVANDGSSAVLVDIQRAFIQFAGFTAGKTRSFFDPTPNFPSYAAHFAGGGSDTGATGITVFAYTAQFGNGSTATLSAEDGTQRRNALWDANKALLEIGESPGPSSAGFNYPGTCYSQFTWAAGSISGSPQTNCFVGDYDSQQIPDIVGSLRVDQAWGTAQVGAALHQLRSQGSAFTPPADTWGVAVSAGAAINLPWNPGDKLWISGGYSEGAPAYNGLQQYGGYGNFWLFNDQNVATGWALDGITGDLPGGMPAGLIKPQAWDVSAAVEHYWTPALRTSVFGQYTGWNPTSAGNALMCSNPTSPARTLGGAAATGAAALPGCDFGFNVAAVGTRTIWNPVKNLDVGLEVMYSQINQNMDPDKIRLNFFGFTGRPGGLYVPSNEAVWSGMVRIQRNFYP